MRQWSYPHSALSIHCHSQSHWKLDWGELVHCPNLHPDSSAVLQQKIVSLCFEHSSQIHPMDHRPLIVCRFHDPHIQASTLSFVDLRAAPQYQTCEQDHT
uniref:Uncharacterized protein n=1 Tax=Opuntia streptacantha TaxID=393608 RepID=A0A7C9AGT8_OPUST